MRSQLSLTLTGETLTLRLSPAEHRPGWPARLLHLARRRSNPRSPLETHTGRDHVLTAPLHRLSETLEHAWATLHQQVAQNLQGGDLTAQLGLAHTRLGLLHQPEGNGVENRPLIIDGYVQAWIRQMWDIDPATQIIRWDRVEGGNDILISCIARTVFVELETFAQRHDMHFISCKPAVLVALELLDPAVERSDTPRILVWTESSPTARRAPPVQLLHCVGPRPKALWRGWIPAPEQADGPDEALLGAIRRFTATDSVDMHVSLVFKHREQAMQKPAPVGASR